MILADLFSWVVAGDPPAYYFSENFTATLTLVGVVAGVATGYVMRMQDEARGRKTDP